MVQITREAVHPEKNWPQCANSQSASYVNKLYIFYYNHKQKLTPFGVDRLMNTMQCRVLI